MGTAATATPPMFARTGCAVHRRRAPITRLVSAEAGPQWASRNWVVGRAARGVDHIDWRGQDSNLDRVQHEVEQYEN